MSSRHPVQTYTGCWIICEKVRKIMDIKLIIWGPQTIIWGPDPNFGNPWARWWFRASNAEKQKNKNKKNEKTERKKKIHCSMLLINRGNAKCNIVNNNKAHSFTD